jgi:hypothetical protein
MQESRWFRRAGPGVATLGAVALVASTAFGAGERTWDPPPCPGTADPVDLRAGTLGGWFQLDPLIEAGERRGQRLSVGTADGDAPRVVSLDPESFASGPVGDRLLVGTDDGAMSRLAIIDLRGACRRDVATSRDVIRRATLTPDGGAIYEFRVDRVTRADLGVWRRDLRQPGAPTRVLAPITPDARFGRTWSTEFSWSTDGGRLAVQSCGEVACRTRVLDPVTGRTQRVTDPALGPLVGLTRDRVVMHGACRGLPCPLLSVGLDDGVRVVLEPAAGRAALAIDPQRQPRVVHELQGATPGFRSVRLDGGDPRRLAADPSGMRLVPGGRGSTQGVEAGPEWLALTHDQTAAGDPAQAPRLRHPTDEPAVTLGEVFP